MTPDELDPDDLPEFHQQPWPGPDLYTLRAWAEVNEALDSDVTIDATYAIVTDAADRAFGRRLYEWVSAALAAEGRDPEDLSALLDDALAERVLEQVWSRMGEDDDAPDLPESDYGWYAYSPDDPNGGRERYRRAVRRRAASARSALLTPRRPRVAGRRDER